jgi:hypothetical protein
LAAAVLSTAGPATAAAAAATARAARSSSSSLLNVEASRMEALHCAAATDSAVHAADVIVIAIASLTERLEDDYEPRQFEQQLQQLAPLVSQDLLLVVATRFGCVLEPVHTMTKGASPWACDSSSSSSTSSRRPVQPYLQVPPYHEQLLSCLGVMTSEQLLAALRQRSSRIGVQHSVH